MVSLVSVPYYANPIDTYALRVTLEDTLLSTVEGMLGDYAKTTETWETPVEFDFEVEIGDEFSAIVGTNDQIYEWVNNGTGEAGGNRADWYPIPTAPTGVAYQSEFTTKTRPGMIQSRGGGKSGPVDVIRAQVRHPGIEPRNFDLTITEKWQPIFEKRFEQQLDDFHRSQARLLRQITRR